MTDRVPETSVSGFESAIEKCVLGYSSFFAKSLAYLMIFQSGAGPKVL